MKKQDNIICFCYVLLSLLSVSFAGALVLVYYSRNAQSPMLLMRHLQLAELLVLAGAIAVLLSLVTYFKEISAKAFTDVTGVRDKKAMEKHLQELQERSDTLNIGIMMFDLNGLKWVNDNYGHEQGDEFIQTFASYLTRILNSDSFLARFGGDEFVIIQEHTTPDMLKAMEGHLRKLVEQYNLETTLPLSYAVGWEVSYKNHYYLMDDLLRTADQNMYIDKNRKKQGRSDEHTHLPAGRHSFPVISEETLITKIESMLHTRRSYLLVVNDIENFHCINDIFGYQMGNQVLDAFYQKMREDKEILFVCRYHSDIFLSITDITDIGEETAIKRTQDRCIRIGEALTRTYPIGNCVIDIGACRMEEGRLSAEEYISRANLACHTAKQNYGHLCYYTEEMAAAEQERARIIQSFPVALKNREFRLYFQPKVDGRTKRIVSAEVLVRWQLPDGSLRAPDSFIPLLERTGEIVQLDYDIYEQSFAWMAAHPGQLPLSLNVSPVHFAHPRQFVQKVKELLARYPVEPSRVIFEITERCYIQNTEAVNQVIHELHQLHIRISMDDFGSGYSSLGSLKDINFDEVKIDRRFIADGLSERGEIVLQEIFHVLKRLKKSIVCEGVETTEVSDFLVEAGCDEIQGYLYYRPMPEQEFEALLG